MAEDNKLIINSLVPDEVLKFVNEEEVLIGFHANGDIFIRGKLVANDIGVVEGMQKIMRRFIGRH